MSQAAKAQSKAPMSFDGMKVEKMSVHVGVNIPGLSVTSLHYKDHNCTMTMTPLGVHVVISADKFGRILPATLLIPWANIHYVKFLEEAA